MKIGEIRRFAIDCSISFLIMLFHAPFYLSHLLVLIFAVDKPIWVNYFCFLILLNGLYQIIFGLNLLVVFFSFLPFLVLDFTLFSQSLDFILFPQKVDEWSLITLEISYLVIGFTIYSFLVPVVNLLRYTTEDKKNKITLCVDWWSNWKIKGILNQCFQPRNSFISFNNIYLFLPSIWNLKTFILQKIFFFWSLF